MADWKGVLEQIKAGESPHDKVRRDAVDALAALTGRNVIAYYSGWLQKPELLRHRIVSFEINDADKEGFMSTIKGLDRSKGLDLILHTPGGDVAATESLVYYLRAMFGTDIRAIVPQIAMSAGTMTACACSAILMGKHSSLGPIDPQFAGLPAHGIIEEFNRAKEEIAQNPKAIPVWQPIIAKYHPTLIGECQKAIEWSDEIVQEWLRDGMLAKKPRAAAIAKRIVTELGSHVLTKSHARHITPEAAHRLGLNVIPIEGDPPLQDAVLTVHHANVLPLTQTPAFKIIENSRRVAYISMAQPITRGE